jgi:hypothetical protein
MVLILGLGFGVVSKSSPVKTSNGKSEKASASRSSSSNDVLVLEPKTVTDPARRGMAAYRLYIPSNWELEGGVQAVPPAYGMIPYLSDVTVRSPDHRGVRFMGPMEFGYADGVSARPFTPYEGRPFMPLFDSLGSFWRHMHQINPAEGVSHLRIVEEEVMEEATELVRRQLAPLYQSTEQENRSLAMTGESKFFDVHVRKLVLQYQENGTEIEATVFSSIRHSIYRWPNGAIRAAMWNIDDTYIVFGPKGSDYLNDPELAAIVRSREVDMAWQAAIEEWYLMKNRQIVAEGRARIAAAARANATTKQSQSDDVLDISFNGWKERNAISDAGQSNYVNSIHERTTYATPGGNTVDLPSYYQNVYTDRLGNYVLHNDANYNINTDPALNGREWQRIEAVR